MELAKIEVVVHGPAATHNMPCAVCRQNHAVLNLSTGIMGPCWTCTGKGYAVVRYRSWWRRVFEAVMYGMEMHNSLPPTRAE